MPSAPISAFFPEINFLISSLDIGCGCAAAPEAIVATATKIASACLDASPY